jgi:hypothetical protein
MYEINIFSYRQYMYRLQNKMNGIFIVLDYSNDVTTQIYRLQTFSKGYKGCVVLIPSMMRIFNQ